MKNKNSLIIGAVIFVVFVSFVVKPYLMKRTALNVVKKVLVHWKKGELTESFAFWLNQEQAPPVYSLMNYEIEDKKYDKKDGEFFGHIFVVLDFASNNVLPSGKTWIFEVKKTSLGWKITDFRMVP